ncbi:hypothetical protein GGF32_009954 [Allomyces javanicus]|nr:hypothetical protein GGF32_009954 [Allomyces javanicus]
MAAPATLAELELDPDALFAAPFPTAEPPPTHAALRRPSCAPNHSARASATADSLTRSAATSPRALSRPTSSLHEHIHHHHHAVSGQFLQDAAKWPHSERLPPTPTLLYGDFPYDPVFERVAWGGGTPVDGSRVESRDGDPRPTLFRNFLNLRQERALRNWQRHSIGWVKTEQRLASRVGKGPEELLMARINEFRQFMEERELVEEAIKVLEANYDFWMTGLSIGHDLLGLNLPLPRSGPRSIERVIHPDQGRADAPAHGPSHGEQAYLANRKQQLRTAMAYLDPTVSSSRLEPMAVIGTGVSSSLGHQQKQLLDRLHQLRPDTGVAEPAETQSDPPPRPPSPNAPESIVLDVTLGTASLSFESVVHEVTGSVVTLYNRGNVAVHFCWERQPPRAFSGSDATPAPTASTSTFYFPVVRGVLLPRSAFDFHVIFKATRPGVYVEDWTVKTRPDVQGLTLRLDGICTQPDTLKPAREHFVRDLTRKAAHHAAKSAVDTILNNVWETLAFRSSLRPFNADAHRFYQANAEFDIPWSPALVADLADLHTRIAHVMQVPAATFSGSIHDLYALTDFLVDIDARESALRDLNAILVRSPDISPPRAFHGVRSAVVDLCDTVGDIAVQIRTALAKLPLDRPCTRKFAADAEMHAAADAEAQAALAEAVAAAAAVPGGKNVPGADKKGLDKKGGAAGKDAAKSAAPGGGAGAAAKGAVGKDAKANTPAGAAAAGTKGKAEDPSMLGASLTSSVGLPAADAAMDAPETWPPERHALEQQYREHLHDMVADEIRSALDRIGLQVLGEHSFSN